ncbi:MAG: acyltransferase family protein [Flavobacteriaceae bacterium]
MPSLKKERLISIDVLRGLTICLMIIVNNPGSWSFVYPPLRHASWDGYTPTDLVFPFFMFIIGLSMYISFSGLKDPDKKMLSIKVLKRAAWIIGFGLFLNAFPYFDFENLRIYGVLQRIGLAYLFAGLMVVWFNKRWLQWSVLLLLFGYWGLLFLSPWDGPLTLEGNLVRFVDLKLLGEAHIYGGYGIPFDPEGLVSTLPSIASILLGYFVAKSVLSQVGTKQKVSKLLILGGILLILGMIWNTWFPINKPIWSSSYVLITTGWGAIVLGVLMYIIDILNWKTWAKPFVHYGRNPLFIYLLSGIYISSISSLIQVRNGEGVEVSFYNYMYTDWFASWAGPMNGSLLFALSQAVLFWAVAYLLYRKNIIIKV